MWLALYWLFSLLQAAVAGAVAGTPDTDTSNTTSYATASWTPTASRLVLVAISNSSGTDATVPATVTGNGLTYTLVASSQRADFQRRVSIYRAWSGASPSAGAITVTFGASQQGCLIHISQWTGTDGSGDNGASAIGSTPATPAWTSISNPSMTLAFDASATSATYGAFSHGADPAVGSGYTLIAETTMASPTNFMIDEWRADADTVVDIAAGAGQGCGVALEIKVPVVAGAFPIPKVLIAPTQAVHRAATF